MSVIQTQTLLAWITIVTVTVDLVPLNKRKTADYLSHTLPTRTEQSVSDGEGRRPRNLGNNDITKLLDDLDNQTEAIKSGQQIGDELLGDKTETGEHSQKNTDDIAEEVTDNTSEAVRIAEGPVLVDTNGVPEKTTAVESGASYLAGKPLLILNKETKDPDVNKWFLYYPLSTESDQEAP